MNGLSNHFYPTCFISFSSLIGNYKLPKKFTFPFSYTPHDLTKLASKELQQKIPDPSIWEEKYKDGTLVGKMFGVLVVQHESGEIGYLAAFSGKPPASNPSFPFVPSIFNRFQSDVFYSKGEKELNELNKVIKQIKGDPEFKKLKKELSELQQQTDTTLVKERNFLKKEKTKRKQIREKQKPLLSTVDFEIFNEQLKKQSLDQQYTFKRLVKSFKAAIEKQKTTIQPFLDEIERLQTKRKNLSGSLQQKLFDQYHFLNANKETKSLISIFEQTTTQKPPSGAGDCAAPRLLQYAYKHNLTPLAMAEFWWGKSPKKEIRKHGHFYPSCRSKCEPILNHMLKGLLVEDNPTTTPTTQNLKIEILFEDEVLLVINKPEGLLSVPGKNQFDSVYSRILKAYPKATGPLIVHRLDMSTSGLMIIAKLKETHKELQSQFAKRTIKKRYIAILEGLIPTKAGTIDLPLRVDLENRPQQLVCYEHGKSARTQWRTIKTTDKETFVHFFPITGRTHQLRVHAAHPSGLNTPIKGDDLYGVKNERLYLHAEAIELIHPITGEKMKFEVKANFKD